MEVEVVVGVVGEWGGGGKGKKGQETETACSEANIKQCNAKRNRKKKDAFRNLSTKMYTPIACPLPFSVCMQMCMTLCTLTSRPQSVASSTRSITYTTSVVLIASRSLFLAN